LDQLPFLRHFLESIPSGSDPQNDPLARSLEESELIVGLLGTLTAALRPIGLGEFLTQKILRLGQISRVCSQATKKLRSAIPVIAAPNGVKSFQKAVSKAADRAAKEVNSPKDITRVIGRHLSTLTQMSEPGFIDLAQLDTGSISLPLARLKDHRAQHARHNARRTNDEMHSKAMLEEMVNPKDEHDSTLSRRYRRAGCDCRNGETIALRDLW
jgi:hypothetical protein